MRINVTGNPAPKGSSQSFAARRKSGEYTGKIGYRPDSSSYPAWAEAVRSEGARAIAGRPRLEGPLAATVRFRFDRPRSHYRTGQFSQVMRPDAPAWPFEGAAAKDIDKLLRAVFDGLQAGGVIANDKQIVVEAAQRVYCEPGETPGAEIWIERAPARPSVFRLTEPERITQP